MPPHQLLLSVKKGAMKKIILSPTPDNAMQTYWGMHRREGYTFQAV